MNYKGNLITSITKEELKKFVINQLNNFFSDSFIVKDNEKIDWAFNDALRRLEYCFEHISDNIVHGYHVTKNNVSYPFFQHTNSDQYCQFLYFFSNSLYEKYPEESKICDKIILLNKALHACWYTYKVKLPDIFLVVHPVGAIIGHAKYNNYLVITQNVTIGEREFVDDEIGEYCFMAPGSSIIGRGKIGKNCSIGINVIVMNEDVPDNTIVYVDKKTGKRVFLEQRKLKSRAQCYFK